MATTLINVFSRSSQLIPLLVCSLVFMFPPPIVSGYLGINYGELGNDLPEPEKAVRLVQSINATKVKIFNSNPKIITAFANTGIELVVGIENNLLPDMQDPEKALNWVTSNVQTHLNNSSKITCIVVGNEVLAQQQQQDQLVASLVPAMQGVHGALVKLGLDKDVSVTTPHQFSVMASSYPPSGGAFREDLVPVMTRVLNFHAQTGSPFFINVYPYFAYKAEPGTVPLDFVLSRPNNGSVDHVTNIRYDDMLSAQVDAVYAAMGSLGFRGVEVCVSETGWPSKGDENEPGATLENASEYNGNVMKRVAEEKDKGKGKQVISVFLFALFNENMKEGATSERNYGLFKPDGTAAYPINKTSSQGNNPGGNGSGTGSGREASVAVGFVLAFCIFLTTGMII